VKPYVRFTASIYIFVSLFAALSISLNSIKISKDKTIPLGQTYSVLAASTSINSDRYVIYGFLPYWVLSETEYLQLDKLTDIAYFALSIDEDGTIRTKDRQGFIDPGYNKWKNSEKLHKLISDSKARGVRFSLTLISHEDDVTYSFLDCRGCWDTLYDEIEKELSEHGLLGLNLDFELVEADSEDGYSQKYSQLVNFLNTKLDSKFGDVFVVTSTLPDSTYRPRITDITSLANASDALFIMAYDFHRPTSENAGPVAPLFGATGLSYDINKMVQDYLKVAPAEKLILGVPYYGYNWVVTDWSTMASRIPGNDVLGYSISQTYEDVVDTRLKYNPSVMWDADSVVPYFTYYNYERGTVRQVYYENKDSLKAKYQYAKQNNLAGIGIWALGYDGGYQELWNLLREEF